MEKELFSKRPCQGLWNDSSQQLNAAETPLPVATADTERVMALSQKLLQENAECYAALSE